jgi:SAM-dependent methyltransferase
MEHEGMVHALDEIRRVLVPDGILVDLRPLTEDWKVEVFSWREKRETGRVTGMPIGIEDDSAANHAMKEAETNGWFKREEETFFPLNYVWDTASEMEEWIEEEWENVAELDEDVKRKTRSAWALGDADSQVRVKVKMLITRWKKL